MAKIRYALERDGARSKPSEDIDNPMSPNFLVMEARTEGQKARWWARQADRFKREDVAELEDRGV